MRRREGKERMLVDDCKSYRVGGKHGVYVSRVGRNEI